MPLVNRGAKLLAALLAERGTQTKLAAELETDQGYLSRIARGERIPGLELRRKLKPLGIDLEAWDEPVNDEPGSYPVATERANGDAA